MRAWALGAIVAGVLGVGACTPFSGGTFECTEDSQCDQAADGQCDLITGFCTYSDGACSSGRRYGDFSGGLSNVCVGDEPVDAAQPADADPNQPDADPNQPDADPAQPDAGLQTLTFQHGANGYNGGVDTFVDGTVPDTQRGSLGDFEWDVDAITTGLLRFDGLFGNAADQIPPGSTIMSATLTLVVSNSSSGTPGDIHDAASNWDETTTFNTLGATAGVQAEDLGTRRADAPIVTGTHQIDVQASLQAWSNNPASNLGWIFNATSNDGCHVISREGAQDSRPLLSVTFLAP